MDWPKERYVKVYTRDTIDWLTLSWQAQGLFCLLLRKVDKAGRLPLGKHGKRGVSAHFGGAGVWAEMEPVLDELLADGCVRVEGEELLVLLIPNFAAAQEAAQTPALRKQAQRERERVTSGHAKVTPGHAMSNDVTLSQLSQLSYPSYPIPDPVTPVHANGKANGQTTLDDRLALVVLEHLNEARGRVVEGARKLGPTDSNLRYIRERLTEGASLEDCQHVIAVCEAEVAAGDSPKWFDAVSPFRPDNFARKLARTVPRAEPVEYENTAELLEKRRRGE